MTDSVGPRTTPSDAFALLHAVDAGPRLERHAQLVSEAGETLLTTLTDLGVRLDGNFVLTGIVLHDVGKTLHPAELEVPGSRHESAGEAMLLARGVDPRLARVCRSHAQWESLTCTLEELVIALADKLWKGVRQRALEERVIEAVAGVTNRPEWDLYVPLDDAFERIAAGGSDRLARSLGR